ncbi:MAG TPA: alpha/beta-type small acid-soluble spore protein [Bacillota bacterium]|nr:alpha/beta-type small acid-soluble spore protein [Bacillota bacterium]
MAGGNKNKLLVPRAAEDAVDKMKEEISQEFNVGLDANTTARENGSVGDEIVKRMIKIAEESMNDKINNVLMGSCTGLFFHPCY